MPSGRRPYGAPLTIEQILAWADAHHARAGRWPHHRSGAVPGVPGQSWAAVDEALRRGCRGLPGGDSLARLLARRRGLPERRGRPKGPAAGPPLTEAQVLAWADAHRERTGRWPHAKSGTVKGGPGLSWGAIDCALRAGGRGLPGGDSLSRLLHRHGRRGWVEREDALVRALPPQEAARRTGRGLAAVYMRRHKLGVPSRPYRRHG